MSVALPALRLSLALGGLVALVQLPFAIHHDGAAVFHGFFTALILVALPAYAAELTFLRIHREPLLIAVFDQMSRRRFRWGWAVSGVLTIVTGLCLATLAHFAAGIIIAALPGGFADIPVSSVRRDYQWRHPLVLLYWLLFTLLLWCSADPQKAILPALSRVGHVLIGSVFFLLVIPGLAHFASMASFPASTAPWNAAMQGFSMGVMASLAGLGVVYTALYNHSARRASEPAHPTGGGSASSLLLGMGFVALVAWVLALIGWADFLNGEAAARTRGIDFLLSLSARSDLSWLTAVTVLSLAVIVLMHTAAYLTAVTLSWIQARLRAHPGIPTVLLLGTALALTRMLDVLMEQIASGQRSSDMLAFLPWLGPALIPLTALVMLSLFTRALPPGPMLWAQGRSLPVAAALYLHWRYPVRLALLISFLHTSGIGAELIAFWQSPQHEPRQFDAG